MLKKFIGTKDFYKSVFALVIPIMIQNGITNFVNMLDNVMVGRVGTTQMTGVAVTNQLIFVFNLCIFGAISGAGIFGAQFYGKGDNEGVRYVFRFKMIVSVIFALLACGLFISVGGNLINLYLNGEGTPEDIAAAFKFARDYMLIMLIGFIPFCISQTYASTLRETGHSVLPMVAGVIAVLTNLSLNYLLIFGKFGAPKLGVAGAAIATVISRFVEVFILIIYTAVKRNENAFINGAFKSFYVPFALVKRICAKGIPLMLNETFWAAGMAMVNQCYSLRGLSVVAANNINSTFFNVFSVAYFAVGIAIGILLGQLLGADKKVEAKNTATKLIALAVFISVIVAVLFYVCAAFIPEIYNTTDEVKSIAKGLMRICAITMPIEAFVHAAYFTLRSGGKTAVTFIFDSGFVWAIHVPVAFVLSRFTSLPILALYFLCQLLSLLKAVIGFYFVKKGVWINNIVNE